ncbi:unnamed protein product [Lymnaea stagnalis]|uniref:Uncharacterized protein n=1 Tax=Lymnaea stagnalis TaxID=6523 RepID=A0AAV2IEU8_LYMST
MFSIILLGALLPFVLGQQMDPAKVCLPDTVQFISFNLDKDEGGVGAIDFKRQLLGSVTPTRTIVQDLAAKKAYVTEPDGSCQASDIADDAVLTQCLPARAVYVAEASWGFGPNALTEDGWQLPFNGGTLKLLITKQPDQPRYIMLSRFEDCKGEASSSFYINPTLNITQPGILDIPTNCTAVL